MLAWCAGEENEHLERTGCGLRSARIWNRKVWSSSPAWQSLCCACEVQGSWRSTVFSLLFPGTGKVLDVFTFVLDVICCTQNIFRTSSSFYDL